MSDRSYCHRQVRKIYKRRRSGPHTDALNVLPSVADTAKPRLPPQQIKYVYDYRSLYFLDRSFNAVSFEPVEGQKGSDFNKCFMPKRIESV